MRDHVSGFNKLLFVILLASCYGGLTAGLRRRSVARRRRKRRERVVRTRQRWPPPPAFDANAGRPFCSTDCDAIRRAAAPHPLREALLFPGAGSLKLFAGHHELHMTSTVCVSMGVQEQGLFEGKWYQLPID